MPICFHCQLSLISETELLRHISLLHNTLHKYTCNESSCNRTFSSFNSFRKHRNSYHIETSPSQSKIKTHTTVLTNILSHHIASESKYRRLESRPENNVQNEQLAVMTNASTSSPPHECDSETQMNFSEEHIDSRNNDESILQLATHNENENSKSLPQPCSSQEFSNTITEKAMLFSAALYNFSDMPRRRVQDVIDYSTMMFKETTVPLAIKVIERLKVLNEEPKVIQEIKTMFDRLENPFEDLDSEWLRFKHFQKSETFIPPEHYVLGQRDEFRIENGTQVLDHVPVTAQFIPLRSVLKQFFEIPAVFNETLQYLQELEISSDITSNIVQCSFWANKKASFGDKFFLPIFMYFDDYENNNPLGSHAGISKCGAVYISIPCLPPQYQSKLQNIFLFVLFNTLDRKVFTNRVIFSRVIEELRFLQSEGITLSTATGDRQIYFSLVGILGDNLGLHSILGFAESFRAHHPCRFCITDRDELKSIFAESQCILRNETNYEEHVELDDVSTSGIKERCIFNVLEGFHVTENLVVDPMHDLFEGVCQYDMATILHHLIIEKNLFSLDTLNRRVNGFNYGPNEKRNKPPEITEARLKKKHLSMTSSEMYCLVKNLSLIIGDLVPEDNPYWLLYILLKKIVDIVTAKAYQRATYKLLATLISEYLTALSIISPTNIKPKHHFLVHYPRIMSSMGPLCNLWSMRFESKHRDGKVTSRVSISRVNVCRTIAIKHQLKLNYRFLHNLSRGPSFTAGPRISLKRCGDSEFESYSQHLPIDMSDDLSCTKWIEYMGKRIEQGTVLMLPMDMGPEFFFVETIFLEKTHEIIIVTRKVSNYLFNDHFQAYEIVDSITEKLHCIFYAQLKHFTVTFKCRLSNGKLLVAKRWI